MILDQHGRPISSPHSEDQEGAANKHLTDDSISGGVSAPLVPNCQEPAVAESNTNGAGQPKQDAGKGNLGNRILVGCNIVLALASIYSGALTREAIDSGNQSSRQTLGQMRFQNRPSLLGAFAARDAAKAVSSQSTDTKDLADAGKHQATASKSIAEATKVIASGSLAQLNISERASQDNAKAFIDGNRAYMAVYKARIVKGDADDKAIDSRLGDAGPRPIVTIEFVNSGNTPSKDTRTRLWFRLKPQITAPDCDAPIGRDESVSVVAKGNTISTTSVLDPRQLIGPPQMIALRAQTAYLVAFGCMMYKDIFNIQRRTLFCAVWDPVTDSMAPCNHYNEIE